MIDFETLDQALKNDIFERCYIFCGTEEKLIKEGINSIVSKALHNDFMELNYMQFDGNKVQIDDVVNACETLPFMGDKKVVLIYRAIFLSDKEDRENKSRFEEINKYINDIPEHCVLIMYYVFEDDREKLSINLKKLEKRCTVLKADKLKGDKLYKKVKDIFESKGKEIGKVELKFFCDNVDNNMDMIMNEINKLVDFCEGRNVTRDDVVSLLPQKSDNDIFDLVDYVSQKKPEKAIDILSQLLYRGENILGILYMTQRQFKLLFSIKIRVEGGKGKDILIKELKLHPYVAEKLITQSKKFTLHQLKGCMELCLNTENILKSTSNEKKTEMELLIINTVRV